MERYWKYFTKGTQKHKASICKEAFCVYCAAKGKSVAVRGDATAMWNHIISCKEFDKVCILACCYTFIVDTSVLYFLGSQARISQFERC